MFKWLKKIFSSSFLFKNSTTCTITENGKITYKEVNGKVIIGTEKDKKRNEEYFAKQTKDLEESMKNLFKSFK